MSTMDLFHSARHRTAAILRKLWQIVALHWPGRSMNRYYSTVCGMCLLAPKISAFSKGFWWGYLINWDVQHNPSDVFFQCPCGHIKFHHRGTRHPPWYRANFGNRSPKAADVWQKPRRFDLDCLSTASWLVMGSIRWPFGLLIEKHDKQIADESQTWVWNSKKCLWI